MTRTPITRCILALAVSSCLLSAQTANPKQPQVKGPKEAEAIQAMFASQDPDARIAAAMNLVTKFSESDFKAIALYFVGFSYQQKGDVENAIVYAEKTLEVDPKFYGAQIMIASGLAQRTKEFDLDREEKLTRADKMAKAAMEQIQTAPKPNAQLTDEQWAAAKKDFSAQAHEALGMAALVRKKYDVCAEELKAAVESAAQPDPSTMVRLASCQIRLSKFDDAIAVLDKALADPNSAPAVKNAAVQLKLDANKGKAAAK